MLWYGRRTPLDESAASSVLVTAAPQLATTPHEASAPEQERSEIEEQGQNNEQGQCDAGEKRLEEAPLSGHLPERTSTPALDSSPQLRMLRRSMPCEIQQILTRLTEGDETIDTLDLGQEEQGSLSDTDLAHVIAHLNETTADSTERCARSVQHNAALQPAVAARYHIGVKGSEQLCSAISHTTALRTLCIAGHRLCDAGATHLADLLAASCSLTSLDVGSNKVHEKGACAMAAMLSVNTGLRTLVLSHNSFGDEGAADLAQALRMNTTLTRLDLAGTSLGDDAGSALAEALCANTTLRALDLDSNWLTDAFAAAAASSFLSGGREREGGGLSPAPTKAKTGTKASRVVSVGGCGAGVECLRLAGNDISSTGADWIARAVQGSTALTTLDLSRNRVGDHGAVSLANAIVANDHGTLRHLSLDGCGVRDEGVAALARALKNINKRGCALGCLSLCGNEVSDAGAVLLAAALQHRLAKGDDSLQQIDLSDNAAVGKRGALAMARALRGLPLPPKLEISGVSLSTAWQELGLVPEASHWSNDAFLAFFRQVCACVFGGRRGGMCTYSANMHTHTHTHTHVACAYTYSHLYTYAGAGASDMLDRVSQVLEV